MSQSSRISASPSALEQYMALAQSFEAACAELGAGKESRLHIGILSKHFAELQATYDKTAKSLTGLTKELQLLKTSQLKAQKVFLQFFTPPSSSSSSIKGIGNYGNNCAFNAVLQMIFHSPALREALLSVPEFAPLRTAYAEYFGLKPGTVDSETIRKLVYPQGVSGTYKDAHEILGTLFERVSPHIISEKFADKEIIKRYAFSGQTTPLEEGSRDKRSPIGPDHSTCSYSPPTPFLFLSNLVPSTGRREADFQQILQDNLNANCIESFKYKSHFLGENPDLLYEYRLVKERSIFNTMPKQLILVATGRVVRQDGANDIPMQVPRVLELPETALSHPDQVPDRRLVLKSFIVYRPGHYVSYIKKGSQWFYENGFGSLCAVSTREVDEALYHYPNGGSYIHYYEKGNADAEPPIPVRQPQKPADLTLKALNELQKHILAKEPNKMLLKLFDALPEQMKKSFYQAVQDKTEGDLRKVRNIGRDLLCCDLGLLVQHGILQKTIDEMSTKDLSKVSQQELALELCDVVTSQKNALATKLFGLLDKKYQDLALKLAKQPTLSDKPCEALAKKVEKMRIVDHLLNAVLDDEIAKKKKEKPEKQPSFGFDFTDGLDLDLGFDDLLLNNPSTGADDGSDDDVSGSTKEDLLSSLFGKGYDRKGDAV